VGVKRLLFGGSAVFGLSAAVATFLANVYWLNAPLVPDLEGYRQETVWDDVLPALVTGLSAEALFLVLFGYASLRLGRSGVISYLVVNAAAAAWTCFIQVTNADPANYAGWAALAIVYVFAAPVVLGITLLIIWGAKRERLAA
jgi:hypothetical protein